MYDVPESAKSLEELNGMRKRQKFQENCFS